MIDNLAAAIQFNRTLIKLDLSANGIQCKDGQKIVKALKVSFIYIFRTILLWSF